ncbi:hypothetical protein GMRT_16377 [Giardia muris]|uniref:SGNH hydrolase-type esterase domain-containing protein n=1 Tax=Giardia muris TaxID=5742 RepID=A0A4Z1SSC4_GIAMU|nr:hypothetical protein GMRT_16377 [Giardia muris]|eukprot:TNJ26558.1 hypothetical protein GMRT_16377 [Giardia muris]
MRVCVFGDSNGAGWRAGMTFTAFERGGHVCWPGLIRERGVEVSSLCTPGLELNGYTRNSTIFKQFLSQEVPKDTCIFILALGTNDILQAGDENQGPRIIKDVKQYFKVVRDWCPGAHCYYLPHAALDLEKVAASGVRVSDGMRKTREHLLENLLDTNIDAKILPVAIRDSHLDIDGIHLTLQGQEYVADVVLHTLQIDGLIDLAQ